MEAQICPQCGHHNEDGARFCSHCGHRFETRAGAARKVVTVLFADLEGSTRLGERLDPEVLGAVLAEFFAAMADTLTKWGGTVSKYIGDAVVAVFGIPASHEDDAARAIRAGLAMQERLDGLNPSLDERFGVQLAMRVGANTGEVLASDDADALMVGDVFNTASRLQGAAEPGTVVVSDRTRLAAGHDLEFVDLGTRRVAGKAEAQQLWQALQPGWTPGPASAHEIPMVGRDAELAMLETVMTQVTEDDRPRLVLVVGEAGIGKSRLVAEFVGTLRNEITRTLFGRCLPYGEGITFWPFRELLWQEAGISMNDSSAEAATKLAELTSSLPHGAVSDASWLTFALATTAGLAMPDNPFEKLSPESAGEELQIAWPAFASGLAAQRPTVLVIEDLHWADRPLVDMVEQLVLRSIGPLMVVGTARPDFIEQVPGWGARAVPSQISLGPLSESRFADLVEELLPDVDSERRGELAVAAHGNPFFAEEMSRHVREGGPDDTERAGGLDLPDTVRSMLAARIDQLPELEREVLQDAAVVGEVFWPATLEAIRGAPVAEALRSLELHGFVRMRPSTSLAGKREMAFHHGLMREVAYQSISRHRRPLIHAAVAEWTETLAADRHDEFIEILAYHYEAASRPEDAPLAWASEPAKLGALRSKAVATALEAGRAARSRFSIDQAAAFARRAGKLATNDTERLAALELEASALHGAARVEEAWPLYLEGIELARSMGGDEPISRVITDSTLMWARYAGAFSHEDWKPEASSQLSRRLQEIGEDGDTFEHAALLVGRAVLARRGGIHRSLADSRADVERSLAIADALGSMRLVSYALDTMEMLVREYGLCEILDVANRMAAVGNAIVDRREAHEMLVTAAISYGEIGHFDQSEEVARLAADEARRMGIHQRIHAARALSAHLLPRGDLARLHAVTRDVPDLVRKDGGKTCEFGAGAVAAWCLAAFEIDGIEAGREALAFFDSTLPGTRPLFRPEQAAVEWLRPFIGPEEARARQDRLQHSRPAHEIYRLRAEIPLVVAERQWDEASGLAAQARELAEPLCAPVLAGLAAWVDAAVSTARGEVDVGLTLGSESLAAMSEPYLAARLAVDLVGIMPGSAGREFRTDMAAKLASMGAASSLAQLTRR